MWGVKSNETGREQQLSVCGNWVGGGEEGGNGGLSQDTSVLVKAGARPERESCVERNDKPKMAASQSSRKRDGGVSTPGA